MISLSYGLHSPSPLRGGQGGGISPVTPAIKLVGVVRSVDPGLANAPAAGLYAARANP
jgi:hypothetical protein